MQDNNNVVSWRTPPPPIPETEVSGEHTADVVVCGLGDAGAPAARAAAESGASVIGFDSSTEKNWSVWGMDVGHINSQFLASRGVPKVDPIDLFNEWMARSGNRANPKLVMQFCQKCGETFDWYCELFSKEQMERVQIGFWPHFKERPHIEIAGQKYWVGTARFQSSMGMFSQEDAGELFTLTYASSGQLQKAKEQGAQLFFGQSAQQLVMDGGRAVGVIVKDKEGKYTRYLAKKGVILATGDFGGNKEMCADLLTDMSDLFEEGEKFTGPGRSGIGIRMGVWAGGRMEARPVPTMGGNHTMMMGPIGSFGGVPWFDEGGRRFCNEGIGDPVFQGLAITPLKHRPVTALFDSGIYDDLETSAYAHGAFWFAGDMSKTRLDEAMESARKAGAEGYTPPPGPVPLSSPVYAADTLEELADRLGYAGEAKETFLASVARYNAQAAQGRDDDFGKDPQMLHPVDEPPYYAYKNSTGDGVGNFLCTVGGLLTDEYQNVLDEKKDPIPGLYATGNCTGRRFGLQYSTPIAGVSIGIAITLGREAGRIVAEL